MNTMIKTNQDEVQHMKIWITGSLHGHFKPTEGLVEKCKFGGVEEVTKAHYLASARKDKMSNQRQQKQTVTPLPATPEKDQPSLECDSDTEEVGDVINDWWEQYYESKKEEWREELAAMKRRYKKSKEIVTILNKKLQDSQRLVMEHTLRVVS